MPFCVSSEGSGESAHLHRLTLAFVTVQTLLCLNGGLCTIHASSDYSGESAHLRRQSLDNVINIKISCAGSKGSWESACLHRLASASFTVSKYHVLVEMAIFVTFM